MACLPWFQHVYSDTFECWKKMGIWKVSQRDWLIYLFVFKQDLCDMYSLMEVEGLGY